MRNALSVVLFACALTACASKQPFLTHEPPKDSVAEFTAPKGAIYTAELPFNAGTGYEWTASRFDKKVVKFVDQSSRRASGDAIPGGPMIEEMHFELIGHGETIIVFELKRPWEKDVPAVDTRSVKVTVSRTLRGEMDASAAGAETDRAGSVHMDDESELALSAQRANEARDRATQLEARRRLERATDEDRSTNEARSREIHILEQQLKDPISAEDRSKYEARLRELRDEERKIRDEERSREVNLVLSVGLPEGENEATMPIGHELRVDLGTTQAYGWIATGWDPRVIVMRTPQFWGEPPTKESQRYQGRVFAFEGIGAGETSIKFELRSHEQISSFAAGTLQIEAEGEPPYATRTIHVKVAEGAKPDPRSAPARARYRLGWSDEYESTIKVGGEIAAELDYLFTQPSRWIVRGYDPSVIRLALRDERFDAPPETMGGGTTLRFLFEALRPGETTILFEYRDWEQLDEGTRLLPEAEHLKPSRVSKIKVKVTEADIR